MNQQTEKNLSIIATLATVMIVMTLIDYRAVLFAGVITMSITLIILAVYAIYKFYLVVFRRLGQRLKKENK